MYSRLTLMFCFWWMDIFWQGCLLRVSLVHLVFHLGRHDCLCQFLNYDGTADGKWYSLAIVKWVERNRWDVFNVKCRSYAVPILSSEVRSEQPTFSLYSELQKALVLYVSAKPLLWIAMKQPFNQWSLLLRACAGWLFDACCFRIALAWMSLGLLRTPLTLQSATDHLFPYGT